MLHKTKTVVLYGSLIVLAGCANYQASSLSAISSTNSSKAEKVSASWKVFDTKDCETYLGRDVLAKGYVPIQMTLENHSEDPLFISPDHFNIVLVPPQKVAEEVHTSTAGRVAAWGAGGLIFFPLMIPAVYDGLKSAEANRSLDADYSSKAITTRTILPYTSLSGIIFVPKEQMDRSIDMFVVNQRTQERISFSVKK
jgi:hypothetical protein